MIPNFPDFKKITLDEKAEIREYLEKHLPFSDYNFLSLWSYNIKEDIVISRLNDNLVIRFRDYITSEMFYSFLGNNEVEKTIKLLLEFSTKNGHKEHLKLVPEINFKKGFPKEFEIVEDPDNFDYIFSTEHLAVLEGSRYHSQKNFINRFNKSYPDHKVEAIDITKAEIQKSVFELFNKWAKKKGSGEDALNERKALERTINDAAHFNLISIGIFDKGILIGFMIGDIDHPLYCETHFAKGDIEYSGIFHMLYHHFAKQLLRLGYKYINNEQDLGIAGLRYSKQQWNPVEYFKKYIVRRKK